MHASLIVERIVRNLVIRCPFECGWTGDLGGFEEEHSKVCRNTPMVCNDCDEELVRSASSAHSALCPRAGVFCRCGDFMAASDFPAHQECCPHRIVECALGCGAQLRYCNRDEHLSLCLLAPEPCEFQALGCIETPLRGDQETHRVKAALKHVGLLVAENDRLKRQLETVQAEEIERERELHEESTCVEALEYELRCAQLRWVTGEIQQFLRTLAIYSPGATMSEIHLHVRDASQDLIMEALNRLESDLEISNVNGFYRTFGQ